MARRARRGVAWLAWPAPLAWPAGVKGPLQQRGEKGTPAYRDQKGPLPKGTKRDPSLKRPNGTPPKPVRGPLQRRAPSGLHTRAAKAIGPAHALRRAHSLAPARIAAPPRRAGGPQVGAGGGQGPRKRLRRRLLLPGRRSRRLWPAPWPVRRRGLLPRPKLDRSARCAFTAFGIQLLCLQCTRRVRRAPRPVH
jgi:hypothetical protein